MATTVSGGSNDSQIMNYLLRMVVPMRREFGRALDVGHFMHDFAYAQEVLDQASTSQDERLRQYANYVRYKMFGPRESTGDTPGVGAQTMAPPTLTRANSSGDSRLSSGGATGPATSPASDWPSTFAAPENQPKSSTDEKLKAKVIKKYTGGLR
jgi:hypothetical protein